MNCQARELESKFISLSFLHIKTLLFDWATLLFDCIHYSFLKFCISMISSVDEVKRWKLFHFPAFHPFPNISFPSGASCDHETGDNNTAQILSPTTSPVLNFSIQIFGPWVWVLERFLAPYLRILFCVFRIREWWRGWRELRGHFSVGSM